jgi:hypothetical protein
MFGQEAERSPQNGLRVRRTDLYRARVAATLIGIISLLNGTVLAYANVAPINVTVSGKKIGYDDFRGLSKGVLTAGIRQVIKRPAEMPPGAPLAFYAGDHVVWVSKTVDQDLGTFAIVSPAAQPAEDAFLAATALAAMDAGTAGEPWETIYRRTPANQSARLALGKAVDDAWKTASDQSAVFATAQTAWIQSHVSVGMTRQDLYAMLKSHGLIPYNPRFATLDPSQGCLPAFRDPSSGTWPYQNQPIPAAVGICAKITRHEPAPNPDALIYIVGAFGLGCETAMETTISFDANDRASKIALNDHPGGCI